ncbi:membrane protein [Sphingomonas hengshuiensis]|uniref:Membrane protein n=2 Tax=Sphingomonas hengshuiensis TaxID=1609977 RepID=A0A7U4J8T0_9SPHN|nr:membrane protein [Sphingomonas hengshuiensis]
MGRGAMIDASLNPLMLSLVVAAIAVLVWGAVRTWRGGDRQKGGLMFACALVILGNLLIWTV